MNSEDPLSPGRAVSAAPFHAVTLSPWINERFPDWEQLLTAHDVARLTRRPRWVLASLILVGRFPRKQRFHGSDIGWLKADVIAWIRRGRASEARNPYHDHQHRHHRGTRQQALPLNWRLSRTTSRALTLARRTRR
jgi:predicted DNA-binding transcriptional regulator AlpA